MRELTVGEIAAIADGAAVLGAGGGGNTYLPSVALRRHLEAGRTVRILDPSEVDPDALGGAVSGMGAPTVGIERLMPDGELTAAVRAMERHLGRPLDFLAIGEIGGGNALDPLIAAAETGLPVVDADPMGRAFPELQMDTFMIGGLAPNPLALHDGKGATAVLSGLPDPFTAERYARALVWAMGGSAGLVLPALTGAQLRRHAIWGTLSLAQRLGEALASARRAKRSAAEALLDVSPGRHLFSGKVVDLARRTQAGFARGEIVLEGLGAFAGRTLTVAFQNEYLVALDGKTPLLTVPDLLVLLEEESGRALGTEILRYGLRLEVLGLPCARELRTEGALAVLGPAAFGYPYRYAPLPGDLLGRPA